jgi:hypothetical protein
MELVSKNPVVAVIDLALPGIKGDEVIWRVNLEGHPEYDWSAARLD